MFKINRYSSLDESMWDKFVPNSNNGTIVLDSPALRDVNLKTVDFDGGRELQFLPMGEPKHGGTIVLNNTSILIESVNAFSSLL